MYVKHSAQYMVHKNHPEIINLNDFLDVSFCRQNNSYRLGIPSPKGLFRKRKKGCKPAQADLLSHEYILACVLRWRVFNTGRQKVRTIEFYETEVRTIELA